MVRRYNRLLVAFYVVTDALLAVWAFILAYGIRFESGLIPVTRGYPPIEQYLHIVPFVAVLTPFAFQLQGIYRLRRGRSRVDDFFAVLIGSILAGIWRLNPPKRRDISPPPRKTWKTTSAHDEQIGMS